MKTRESIGAAGLFVLIIVQADAQQIHQAMASGGGDASGATGSVSYTIGQTFYTTTSGVTGTAAEGIQTTLNLGNPLPVKLITFGAKCVGGKVHLNWETAMEVNNDFFVAERSSDARTWASVATIRGENEPENYSCIDERPAAPVSYYRLKQVDTDGTYTYSRLIHVLGCAGEAIAVAIYPNPTDTGVFLSMEDRDSANYELYNLKGILLRKETIRKGKTYIDMSKRELGAYVLKLIQNNHVINSFSIIKN